MRPLIVNTKLFICTVHFIRSRHSNLKINFYPQLFLEVFLLFRHEAHSIKRKKEKGKRKKCQEKSCSRQRMIQVLKSQEIEEISFTNFKRMYRSIWARAFPHYKKLKSQKRKKEINKIINNNKRQIQQAATSRCKTLQNLDLIFHHRRGARFLLCKTLFCSFQKALY